MSAEPFDPTGPIEITPLGECKAIADQYRRMESELRRERDRVFTSAVLDDKESVSRVAEVSGYSVSLIRNVVTIEKARRERP